MRQKKIALIRKKLVKKLDQLWSNAHRTLSTMKNNESKTADPFDLASTESIKYVELACRGRERTLILEIHETILRIDRGIYGTCQSCGQVIHEKRLNAEPMSKLCANCQEEKEMNDKRQTRLWAMKGVSYSHV